MLVLKGGDYAGIISAGLPDITGYLDIRYAANKAAVIVRANGAFESGDNISLDNANALTLGETVNSLRRINFSAAESNSVYGKSTIVQPPALSLIPQIKY